MALFVSLARDSIREELGEFELVRILENEIRAGPEQTVIAWHTQHRWRSEHGEQSYNKIEITGPLTITIGEDSPAPQQRFGPYGAYHYMDGVAYADGRVFGFWDLSASNWYLTDVGVHCKTLTIRFLHPAEKDKNSR
jgi:hypothetical protein